MNDTLHPLHQRISTDLSQFKDHDTVDLVVIGSGGAGFSAALNAAIDGARVLLVERMAHAGGTTALSAGTALLLNIGRNTFLAFHALGHGSKSLERDLAGIEHGQPGFSSLGTVHDLAGNVAMVAALLLLVAFVPLLNRLGRPQPPPSEA